MRSWDDVPFEAFLKLQPCKDDTECMAVLLGIDDDTLRKATIANVDEFIESFAWMRKPMPMILPRSINGFQIPKDLNFKTIGRYEDAKEIAAKLKPDSDGKQTVDQLRQFVQLVGIYAQPDYHDSTVEDRLAFANQFLKSPCTEVMAVANFTLARLVELNLQGLKTFPRFRTQMRKFRLVMNGFLARLAFSVRFGLWKRKLDTNRRSF